MVWSPSGCRLLCSLRQSQALGAQGSMTGAAPASPTRGQGSLLKTPQGCCLPLEVRLVCVLLCVGVHLVLVGIVFPQKYLHTHITCTVIMYCCIGSF